MQKWLRNTSRWLRAVGAPHGLRARGCGAELGSALVVRQSVREDLHNNAGGPAQRTPSVSSLSCSSFTSLAPAFSTVVGCLSALGSELMVTGLDDWSLPRGLTGGLRPKMVEENMFGSSKTPPLVSACTATQHSRAGDQRAKIRIVVCVCVCARAHTHTQTRTHARKHASTHSLCRPWLRTHHPYLYQLMRFWHSLEPRSHHWVPGPSPSISRGRPSAQLATEVTGPRSGNGRRV